MLVRLQWKHFMDRNESLLGGQTDGLPLNTEDSNLEKNRFYMTVGRMEVFELTNAMWINQELDSFPGVIDQCVMLGRQWLSW